MPAADRRKKSVTKDEFNCRLSPKTAAQELFNPDELQSYRLVDKTSSRASARAPEPVKTLSKVNKSVVSKKSSKSRSATRSAKSAGKKASLGATKTLRAPG